MSGTYRFMPAHLHSIGVFVAIGGGSVSGKTLTALRLARGIAGPNGKIYAIDTEGGRMSMYAALPGEPEIPGKKYHFDSYQMKSPFHPQEFANAIAAAEAEGAAVCVTDSWSLEWSGLGGVLDLQRQELARLQTPPPDAPPDWKPPRAASDDAWRFAKLPHKLMRDQLIQSSMPVIFCVRANTVLKHFTDNPRADGRWKAEQDERWIYEWTIALTLHPDTPGQPRYDLKTPKHVNAWKMPEEFAPFFPPGQFITEEAGAKIQAWRLSHSNTARRTVRDIVRDRCAAAADSGDIDAIEAMEPVKHVRKTGTPESNAALDVMLNEARARIAKELAASQTTAQRELDSQADRGEPDEPFDDETDQQGPAARRADADAQAGAGEPSPPAGEAAAGLKTAAAKLPEKGVSGALAQLATRNRDTLGDLLKSPEWKALIGDIAMNGGDDDLMKVRDAQVEAARREPGGLI